MEGGGPWRVMIPNRGADHHSDDHDDLPGIALGSRSSVDVSSHGWYAGNSLGPVPVSLASPSPPVFPLTWTNYSLPCQLPSLCLMGTVSAGRPTLGLPQRPGRGLSVPERVRRVSCCLAMLDEPDLLLMTNTLVLQVRTENPVFSHITLQAHRHIHQQEPSRLFEVDWHYRGVEMQTVGVLPR